MLFGCILTDSIDVRSYHLPLNDPAMDKGLGFFLYSLHRGKEGEKKANKISFFMYLILFGSSFVCNRLKCCKIAYWGQIRWKQKNIVWSKELSEVLCKKCWSICLFNVKIFCQIAED